MMKKRVLLITLIAMFFVVLVACGGDETDGVDGNVEDDENPGIDKDDRDPVTLQMAVLWPEAMFDERIKNPVEEEFDHITMEFLFADTYNVTPLEEMFAAGHSPDMFFTMSYHDIERFELDADILALAEEAGIEMNTDAINDNLLDYIVAQDYSRQQRLYSWPYETTYYAILYNKEIFDRMGKNYPSDDMTWDELLDLGEELTQNIDGTQFRGIDIEGWYGFMQSQFGITATDPETGEVLIDQMDEWSQIVNFYDRYNDIQPAEFEGYAFGDHDAFRDRQTTAMFIANAQAIEWFFSDPDTILFDWDVAAIPYFASNPGIAPHGGAHTITPNPYGENIEDVLLVLNYLSSQEYQHWMARKGIAITTSYDNLEKVYFSDLESTKGKNISAIFAHEPASPPSPMSQWDEYVEIDLHRMYDEERPPNEWLRIFAEEAEADIAEALAKQ